MMLFFLIQLVLATNTPQVNLRDEVGLAEQFKGTIDGGPIYYRTLLVNLLINLLGGEMTLSVVYGTEDQVSLGRKPVPLIAQVFNQCVMVGQL
jgi:hypothetical protein